MVTSYCVCEELEGGGGGRGGGGTWPHGRIELTGEDCKLLIMLDGVLNQTAQTRREDDQASCITAVLQSIGLQTFLDSEAS